MPLAAIRCRLALASKRSPSGAADFTPVVATAQRDAIFERASSSDRLARLLAPFILAHNVGNFLRRLELPKAVKDWSLRSLQVKLAVPSVGRVEDHPRSLCGEGPHGLGPSAVRADHRRERYSERS